MTSEVPVAPGEESWCLTGEAWFWGNACLPSRYPAAHQPGYL